MGLIWGMHYFLLKIIFSLKVFLSFDFEIGKIQIMFICIEGPLAPFIWSCVLYKKKFIIIFQ